MTNRELLDGILHNLPEHRVQEVLDFVQFLSVQEDRAAWQQFGQQQLAQAYGDDEPDYGEDDIRPELS
jgi:hypothetical protein